MIVIRATDTELDVCGSLADLSQVRDALAMIGRLPRAVIEADTEAEADPYDRILDRLEIQASAGPVCVSVVDYSLRVTGSVPMLECFASFFDFDQNARPGTHNHHNWWEGNEYIAEDSRPLVVTVA